MAQKESPSKGDFLNLVKADFEFIGVTFNEEAFCQMSQKQFKTLVHNRINAAAFKEFTTLQAQHSKVRDIPYQVLSIQKYLKSRDFSKADRDLLMALRSHSLKGIKANFSSINQGDMSCPLKYDISNPEDNQIPMMSCQSICSWLDSKYIEQVKDTQYSYIYGDLRSQKTAVSHLSYLLDIRRTILGELQTATASTSGHSSDTAPRARQGSSGD